MTRPELMEHLTAYIDGELDPQTRAEVEAALASDPELRAMEQGLRTTVATMQQLPAPADASADLRRRVLSGFAQHESPPWWRRWLTVPRLVPVLGAGALAAVVVVARGADERALGGEPDAIFIAQHLDELEALELQGLESEQDLDLVLELHTLEATP